MTVFRHFFLVANVKETEYESITLEEFSRFDPSAFVLNRLHVRIFLCGGEVNVADYYPARLRQRFVDFCHVNHYLDADDSFVMAEIYKDYLANNYSDLMTFEHDIAALSTLIVLFLESPGSFVELGLFCDKPNLYKKMIVVVPESEVRAKDSFIYLGPLSYLKDSGSNVYVCPWPEDGVKDYPYLDEIVQDVQKAIKSMNKTESFDQGNFGHVAYLVLEIVNMLMPVKLKEIDAALHMMDIKVSEGFIKRCLYLLERFRFVGNMEYAKVIYFYSVNNGVKVINFGKAKDGKVVDYNAVVIKFRKTLLNSADETSRKRALAMRRISEILGVNK